MPLVFCVLRSVVFVFQTANYRTDLKTGKSWWIGEGEKSPCKTYLNSRLFVQVEILAATAAIVWLLAMIFDPIINTVADRKIMAMLRNWSHCFRRTVKSVRRQVTVTTQVSRCTATND
ncbi:hypothetical protein RB195_010222 [Necator americanus]|uniref:Frizzled/Smoothened transmembrane domain-containing protein n=1 Tax=Necator americanus TaxID=51031 RepID=A0ABR1CXR0_NECAM